VETIAVGTKVAVTKVEERSEQSQVLQIGNPETMDHGPKKFKPEQHLAVHSHLATWMFC
jgi:predicted protein tyrosine phosphatase